MNNTIDTILSIKFPKNAKIYLLNILLIIFVSLAILFAILNEWSGSILDKFAIFLFGVASIIIIYDRVYQFITMDCIEIRADMLLIKKRHFVVASSKINELAIKVNTGIDGVMERSFYNMPTRIKLLTYKENDIGKEESNMFLERLAELSGCAHEILSESTHGQVVPLDINDVSPHAVRARSIWTVQKDSWGRFGFMYVLIIAVLAITAFFIVKIGD